MDVSEIVSIARQMTNDEDPEAYRVSFAEFELWLREGIAAMYSLRPDIFIGQFTTLFPQAVRLETDPLPVDEQFAPVLADWLVFRAESVDDEFVETSRAQATAQFFAARI
jgi:hypothetical protein